MGLHSHFGRSTSSRCRTRRRASGQPRTASLITQLEELHWTGRPSYPIRAMVGLALVKSLHMLPIRTQTVALVRDHDALRDALGAVPSVDAAYRLPPSCASSTSCWPRALTR